MKLDIHMRRVETGETRVLQPPEDYRTLEEVEAEIALWRDGQLACDAERSLYFYQWDYSRQLPPGEEQIIVDKITARQTNRLLYAEY